MRKDEVMTTLMAMHDYLISQNQVSLVSKDELYFV